MDHEYASRPARNTDNFTRIASLIYATDPYIYPFWFGDESQAIMPLYQLIHTPGTVFNLDNIFVVEELWRREILGVIVAISARSKLDYDYSELKATNDQYRFAIERYIEPSVRHAQKLDHDAIMLLDCCIAPESRNHGLGKTMLSDFMNLMRRRGFRRFELDCLSDNQPALALYHGLGFQDIKSGIGFDGTDHSQVAITSLACQL